jgi:hypothetical protein
MLRPQLSRSDPEWVAAIRTTVGTADDEPAPFEKLILPEVPGGPDAELIDAIAGPRPAPKRGAEYFESKSKLEFGPPESHQSMPRTHSRDEQLGIAQMRSLARAGRI